MLKSFQQTRYATATDVDTTIIIVVVVFADFHVIYLLECSSDLLQFRRQVEEQLLIINALTNYFQFSRLVSIANIFKLHDKLLKFRGKFYYRIFNIL